MGFSVIIPTYNSASTLAALLQDLSEQTYPSVEVIVSDGGSTDRTTEIAAHAGVQVIDNPVRHAAGGRNRAATRARGNWLAFTDSDCRLKPDWLARAAALIEANPDIVGLAGPMMALPPRNEIERVAGEAFLQGVLQFPTSEARVHNRGLRGAFITANVFYRRDVFAAIGGFDEWFANQAEDIDLYWRLLKNHSGRLLYSPDLVVYHCFPTTWRGLWRKWQSYGIASGRLQKRHLGHFHVDGSHYKRLGQTMLALVKDPRQRSTNLARLTQLAGHLSGKYIGSVKFRIVNL